MLPINCDVVGILIKRHASPFVNDTSNYQKKQICTFSWINKYLYNFFVIYYITPNQKQSLVKNGIFFLLP